MSGASYRVFDSADSLDHRLAAVSKCLLLAGGVQRGLEASETFTSGPQPDHLYGLATAEELSDKEEVRFCRLLVKECFMPILAMSHGTERFLRGRRSRHLENQTSQPLFKREITPLEFSNVKPQR